MDAHFHLADPRLRRDISRYVITDGPAVPQSWIPMHTLYIHLPECELHTDDGAVRGDVLHIVAERAVNWELRAGRMLVVNFIPGGVTRLFGLDATGLPGTIGVDEPLPGDELAAVAEAARATDGSPQALVRALDQAFLERLPAREPEGLAERAYVAIMESDSPGAFEISRLAEDLGVSHRTLQRAFKRRYGVTMARWLRFSRFWGALQVSSDKPSVWKHLPSNFGYVDQSHFLRDARDIAGTSPEALRSVFKVRWQFYPHGSFRTADARENPAALPEWKAHYLGFPGARHWLPEQFFST